MSEPGSSRREFVQQAARALFGTALAACGRPAGAPAPSAELAVDVGGLSEDGRALVTTDHGPDGAPILIVRRGSADFRAFSMQCTHEGCPLSPPSGGRVMCPCHGSQFDLSGKVLVGPAVYPLGRYQTRYDERAKRLTVRFGR